LRGRRTPVILATYAMRTGYRRLTRCLLFFPLGLCVPSVAGCGHPATEAECQFILDRIVDLELQAQNVTDPAEMAKRRGEGLGLTGDAGRRDLYEGCVGRHITDRAVDCVRNAKTAQEITDSCLK
jgi:hypothetical protein